MSKTSKSVKNKKNPAGLVDSSLTATESKESAERAQAELKKSDPDELEGVMAKLLRKDDEETKS